MTSLETRLLDAHARGAHSELVPLYTQAANRAGDIDAQCFFLTQAYVFALETNHQDTPSLRERLELSLIHI